jgi:hypothetical protein
MLLLQVLLCLAVVAMVGLSIAVLLKLNKCSKQHFTVLPTFNQYTGNTCTPDMTNFDVADCQNQFANSYDGSGIYCNGAYQDNYDLNNPQNCDQCSPMASSTTECATPSCACPTDANGQPQDCGCTSGPPPPPPPPPSGNCSACTSLNASCQGMCELGLANYKKTVYTPCTNSCNSNLSACMSKCTPTPPSACIQDCIDNNDQAYGWCDGMNDDLCMTNWCSDPKNGACP